MRSFISLRVLYKGRRYHRKKIYRNGNSFCSENDMGCSGNMFCPLPTNGFVALVSQAVARNWFHLQPDVKKTKNNKTFKKVKCLKSLMYLICQWHLYYIPPFLHLSRSIFRNLTAIVLHYFAQPAFWFSWIHKTLVSRI